MLSLFKQYGHYLVFVLLEGVCLYLIVNYNQTQRSIFIHSSNEITGSILQQTAKLDEYSYVRNENKKLHKENAALIREILALTNQLDRQKQEVSGIDTSLVSATPATIINQSILSNRNHITLDRGSSDGVKRGMGLISDEGIVGIISEVGSSYSTALSMLNVDVFVSASVKGPGYFGSVSWKGRKINELTLTGIPKHASVVPGDTVITNGYSTIFPPGILIGTVTSGKLDKSGEYYEFTIQPSVDFSKVKTTYAIDMRDFTEEIEAEESEE